MFIYIKKEEVFHEKKSQKKAMAIGGAISNNGMAAPAAVSAAGDTSRCIWFLNIYVQNQPGNMFSVIMYEGFSSYMEQVGENCRNHQLKQL